LHGQVRGLVSSLSIVRLEVFLREPSQLTDLIDLGLPIRFAIGVEDIVVPNRGLALRVGVLP
jgi:hypothetical protein